MRLQSAIFHLEDTLLGPAGLPNGAEQVLSILKMESVWLAAVTRLDRAAAEDALKQYGLTDYFRVLLSEQETKTNVLSAEMLEKAMRRLHSARMDTVVFCGTAEQISAAKSAGLRAAAVRTEKTGGEWEAMQTTADYAFADYRELLEQDEE